MIMVYTLEHTINEIIHAKLNIEDDTVNTNSHYITSEQETKFDIFFSDCLFFSNKYSLL